MKMQPWHQRLLAGVAAVAIFWSAASDEGRQAAPKQARASAPPARVSALPLQPGRVELERLGRPDAKATADPSVGNAFSATSWYVPPPPPPPKVLPPAPPPPPTAPPMPFSFLGRYEDGARRIILLVRGDLIYAVSEGEVIDNTYRVDRMTAAQVELTYLPLNIQQTISTGGS